MKGIFIDAVDDLADILRRVTKPGDPHVDINEQADVPATDLARLTAGYDFVLNDHTFMPTDAMRACTSLKHVVFLGTGASSYVDLDAAARHPDAVLEIIRHCGR